MLFCVLGVTSLGYAAYWTKKKVNKIQVQLNRSEKAAQIKGVMDFGVGLLDTLCRAYITIMMDKKIVNMSKSMSSEFDNNRRNINLMRDHLDDISQDLNSFRRNVADQMKKLSRNDSDSEEEVVIRKDVPEATNTNTNVLPFQNMSPELFTDQSRDDAPGESIRKAYSESVINAMIATNEEEKKE